MTSTSSSVGSSSTAGLELWVAIARQTAEPRDKHREAHREYMRRIVAAGQVFASGPASDHAGDTPFGGITILRAATEEDARSLMDNEPYVRAGARTYELIAWDVRHGNYAQDQ